MMDAALEVAKKSIVLLKNENEILPLKKNGVKIGLIGPLAADKNSPLGNWRIGADNNTAISVLEGLKNYKGNDISHAQGVKLINKTPDGFHEEVQINTTDKTGFDEAIALAKKVEVVIMVLGEHGFQSGEGRSRSKLDLPGFQKELLEEVAAVNPNIVLVLMNGRPLILNWAAENIPAIVEAWQLGTQSGNAIAQVLYGDYNPSGKLPMSFPRAVGQVPIYYNYKNTGRPTGAPGVFWSHYEDEENSPLYPFGYGLSYTSFEYSNLKTLVVSEKEVQVSVTLKNSGKQTGKEVVQLYIRDHFASVTRPVRELKGFELVSLEPNEIQEVSFTLSEKELGFYDNDGNFILESGDFSIFVGGNSNANLKATITL